MKIPIILMYVKHTLFHKDVTVSALTKIYIKGTNIGQINVKNIHV